MRPQGSIFILDEDNTLLEMQETEYASEELLQELLDDYPNLLAGDQINSQRPRKWLPVSREMGVPAEKGGGNQWYLDHFFIDQDCIPTFVEVKRSTDTRIRREVVGQMLDYAANALKHWPVGTIQKCFEARCAAHHINAGDFLEEFLGSEGGPELVSEQFWKRIQENMQEGKIRMLFVSDEIPSELQSIIEFLNNQMTRSEVLGIEVKQYTQPNGKIKTLVPRVVGKTAQAERKDSAGIQIQWNEETFFSEIEKRHGVEARRVYEDMYIRCKKYTNIVWWGKGNVSGSFIPGYKVAEDGRGWHALCYFMINGKIQVGFSFMNLYMAAPFKGPEGEENRRILGQKFMALGVDVNPAQLSGNPGFSWSLLKSQKKRKELEDIYKWYFNYIKDFKAQRG